MRIIGGRWRGRVLQAPAGQATRPTAERVRQALFDRLMHAPWAGRGWLDGAAVLDAFAGTGALGLEALSRGAAHAVFIERDRTALAALRANIAACAGPDPVLASVTVRIIAGDTLAPPPGQPVALVFLDPPYGQGIVPRAMAALTRQGWAGPDTLWAIETGRDETGQGEEGQDEAGQNKTVPGPAVATFSHGAATVHIRRGLWTSDDTSG